MALLITFVLLLAAPFNSIWMGMLWVLLIVFFGFAALVLGLTVFIIVQILLARLTSDQRAWMNDIQGLRPPQQPKLDTPEAPLWDRWLDEV